MMHKIKDDQLFNNNLNSENDDEETIVNKVIEQLKFIQAGLETESKKECKEVTKKCNKEENVPSQSNTTSLSVKELRRNITILDTLNPMKEKTYKQVEQIIRPDGSHSIICQVCDKEFQRSYDFLRLKLFLVYNVI